MLPEYARQAPATGTKTSPTKAYYMLPSSSLISTLVYLPVRVLRTLDVFGLQVQGLGLMGPGMRHAHQRLTAAIMTLGT